MATEARPPESPDDLWSPPGATTRAEFFKALRAMQDRAGFGYPTFAKEARKLVKSGRLPADRGPWPLNPLPRSSLHRAMTEEDWRWLGKDPRRLEVYLRVAGCPESARGRWLSLFHDLDEDPPPPAEDGAEPPAVPRHRLRNAAVGALVGVGAMYLMVLAGRALFYDALGVALGEVPLDHGTVLAATVLASVLVALVTTVLLGSYAVGAALVPIPAARAIVKPAAALATSAWVASFFLLAAVPGVPDGLLTVGVAMVGAAWLGALGRMIQREHWLCLFGALVGGTAAGAAIGLFWVVLAWTGARGTSVAVLVAAAGVAVAAEVVWLRRRSPPAPEGSELSPLELLGRLRRELTVSRERDLARPLPRGEARKAAVGLLTLPVIAVFSCAAVVLYLVGTAADAGRAARELGHTEAESSPLLWTDPVRPAVVAPREPGEDPLGICTGGQEWTSSLIARDADAHWVLLRPSEPDGQGVEVVRLPASDYAVRLVPEQHFADGEPWRAAACAP